MFMFRFFRIASQGGAKGISLGDTPIKIRQFAFGRDNTGAYVDRANGEYVIQTTTVPNPTATTTEWTSIARVVYPAMGVMPVEQGGILPPPRSLAQNVGTPFAKVRLFDSLSLSLSVSVSVSLCVV